MRTIQPVANEPSLGTQHKSARVTPAGFDIGPRTEVVGAPYVWDLSGASIAPIGTKAVKIHLLLNYYGAAGVGVGGNQLCVWDYDSGAYNMYYTQIHGGVLRIPYAVSVLNQQHQNSGEVTVDIGSSRKVYIAMDIAANMSFFAVYQRAIL